ncbi:unnamed protein product [Rotaria sp. Silwood2]|nr:unnamed protein product [Rotaria sp. Silwood2]CAF2678530.1 unnamed protein product [Rotaria sp. Silwood2]CAF3091726.1 unnamed protein product [Rotaria sp. Silwood2]CAF4058116.1 unnamed protein product [Rotaria sp. Silwood2]CAF4357887.1 unnamed protein product [Rotaria sp. Silwood2]
MHSGECSATISVHTDCKSSTVDLTDTEIANSCTTGSFFWSYPTNNLTIIIKTPFTKKQEAFKIDIDNQQLMQYVLHVYRVFDDKELEVTTTADRLIQDSSNYEIALKFEGPPNLMYYGVFINYNVIKNDRK